MTKFLTQIRNFYGSLDERRRRQLWVAVAMAAVVMIGVGSWVAFAPFQPLLTNRSYDELTTAAAALDAEGVAYRITDTSLEVPVKEIGRAKAALGSTNMLPSLTDVQDLKLGLTPAAQEWAFLRAREGDIARMINGMSGIIASQVNIVPREESLYFGEERPASASVFVRLQPGASMREGQIRAISNLVANAVEGLNAGRVTIADDRGTLLASGEGDRAGLDTADPSSLYEYRTRVQRGMEKSVHEALFPVIGNSGDFSVTATVELDLTSRETRSKRVEVDNQAVLAQSIDESKTSRGAPKGVPGVDANLPEMGGTGGANSDSNERMTETTNYAYPTVDEVAHKPAGEIQRISVSVTVNDARVADLVEAAGEGGTTEEQMQAEIVAAVQAAVGYSEARGDTVTVNFLPFAEPRWVVSDDSVLATGLHTYLPYAVGVFALLLAFFFIVRPLMAAVTGRNPLTGQLLPLPAEGDLDGLAAMGEDNEESAEDLANRLRLLVDNFQAVDSSDLNRLVEKESMAAAQVIRQWTRS